jgi:soluble lytic murein transglycosylase-like protein
MSLLLTICLSVPGVCENNVDQHEALALAEANTDDPVQKWRRLVADEFPAREVETALCVIRHESGGNPDADNPRSSAKGLFQVLGSLWASHYGVSQTELYDPATNVRIAAEIWRKYGWSAWSPYQRGACRSG